MQNGTEIARANISVQFAEKKGIIETNSVLLTLTVSIRTLGVVETISAYRYSVFI